VTDGQVFISYAHTPTDTPLAHYIARALRSVGINVWLDESTLTGGDLLQQTIQAAIDRSSCAIFLVSPTWLVRDWTMFELEQFSRKDPDVVRRIPVFRAPRRDMVIPPALVRVTGFEWLEADSEPERRMWEVYCAVSRSEPGPSETWATKWQTLPKATTVPTPPPMVRAATRLVTPPTRPSLRCDRAVQWARVDELAIDQSNQLILLPGGVGQAHEHFVERIQRLLRLDPPRGMVTVDWPTRPRSRDEFTECLARALDVDPAGVASELAGRLAHQNLLLLHPCLRARFVDDALVRYYTDWLPALLAGAHPAMFLKAVQPVEFPRTSTAQAVLSWLRLRDSGEDSREDAEALLTSLKDSAAPLLRAFRLRDLADVTTRDLEDFCDVSGLNPTQRQWLLAQVAARGSTPRDVFQALDDFLPDARSL
jgi:hypothetical protein